MLIKLYFLTSSIYFDRLLNYVYFDTFPYSVIIGFYFDGFMLFVNNNSTFISVYFDSLFYFVELDFQPVS